ncbi:MAG: AsmA family protein [Pseudomonadota bacterium]
MRILNSFLKILLWTLLAFFFLVCAFIIFILNYDWDRSRPWINKRVSEAIGRSFSIDGHVAVGWNRPDNEKGWRSYIPWPRFTAETLRIKNPEWAKKPYWITLDKIAFDVEVLPLLYKDVVIPRLTMTQPYMDLERLAEDKVNWDVTLSSSPTVWKVNLQEVSFATGQVDISDKIKKLEAAININTLGQAIEVDELKKAQEKAKEKTQTQASSSKQNQKNSHLSSNDTNSASKASSNTSNNASDNANTYAFGLTVKGTFNNAPVKGTGKIGGLISFVDKQNRFPIQADFNAADNHFTFTGSLSDPANLAAFDVQLSVSSISMAHLYELTGITLPETPPFKTHGHLIGNLRKGKRYFKYQHFSGTVGSSDLSGSLQYYADPKPKLSGNVSSQKLVFADLAPLIGADSNAKKAKRGAAPQKTTKAVPTEQFRTERWRAMDADVVFTGKQIIKQGSLPVSDLHTHLMMKDGVLTLNPLEFGVAGGSLAGNIHLDGSKVPMKGNFDITAKRLKLKQLFPTLDLMRTSIGQVSGQAKLEAVGNSPAAWMASSNGEVKLVLQEGQISSLLLEEAGLNVANIVVTKMFGDKTVKINCAAADFIVKQGVLDSHLFAIDTEDALISVDGTVNLATEQMNLDINPKTKGFRIFSLRSPLYVKGTFKKPDVGVKIQPLLLRGGGAIGLGLINPAAALIALIAPSNNDILPCKNLMANAGKPIAPPSTKKKTTRR